MNMPQFIHSLMGRHLSYPNFMLIDILLLQTLLYMSSGVCVQGLPEGIFLGVELLGHTI